MRVLQLLSLAAIATAFVIPDQEIFESLLTETENKPSESFVEKLPSPQEAWEEIDESFTRAFGCAKHKFGDAVDTTFATAVKYGEKFEDVAESWLTFFEEELDILEHPPPHHGPGKGPGKRPGKRPGKKPPHRRPPHHHKSNMTVYELIAKSKYTTVLAELINDYPDLVEVLNGTKANYTVFAPTNKAFEKIPKGAPKPSKSTLKKILSYHVSPEFYPAHRVLTTRTIPTAVETDFLPGSPQRLSTQVSMRGLTVNFYSRIVAVDIFGTNGVIHGVDSILAPPPKFVDILGFFPGQFSTLELALVKTGLYSAFNDTSSHKGGTVFAPSNFAFQKLGPRINAFLFSKYGEKYLKALVLYHTAENFTLYSDAYYPASGQQIEDVPKSKFHVDLESGLAGKSLSVDVIRFGRYVNMKINGFTSVSVLDGIAEDGVIHVVPSVLIPPKTPGVFDIVTDEMTVEELKERLAPFVEHDDFEVDL